MVSIPWKNGNRMKDEGCTMMKDNLSAKSSPSIFSPTGWQSLLASLSVCKVTPTLYNNHLISSQLFLFLFIYPLTRPTTFLVGLMTQALNWLSFSSCMPPISPLATFCSSRAAVVNTAGSARCSNSEALGKMSLSNASPPLCT